jgi:signal transduction histidine kinase/DNA-binding response OmpR family regulator
MMSIQHSILVMGLRFEEDIARARSLARTVATKLGFEKQDQVRIAIAVSEIVRIVFPVLNHGEVEFLVNSEGLSQTLLIHVSDRAADDTRFQALFADPRAREVEAGITSARRLMDRFAVESAPGKETLVSLEKDLTASLISTNELKRLANDLAYLPPQNALEEIQHQNQELTGVLEDLHQRQKQLSQLNRELQDTNRGVMALYTELEEQAQQLRTANTLKSRYLSYMSHEFRTPLGSIVALTRILLDKLDGDLTTEQEHQVNLIMGSAQDLLDMIGDLLDLTKLETGKLRVNPTPFEVIELLGGARGMFRPLFAKSAVELIIDDPVDFPMFFTDQHKVAQILRNLISNALKYTEKGAVRVSVELDQTGTAGIFSVTDTGIGISAEDQQHLFQDFTQLNTHLHRLTKGVGLGLSISKQLAELLNGALSVESEPRIGSTFTLIVPLVYTGEFKTSATGSPVVQIDDDYLPLLVLEDDPDDIAFYEQTFSASEFRAIIVNTIKQARQMLAILRPVAVILDILLPNESGWEFLTELKGDESTRDIPVIVATVTNNGKDTAAVLGAHEFATKPLSQEWLLGKLRQLEVKESILIIDDDDVTRYSFRKIVGSRYQVVEAANGAEGLRLAKEDAPEIIFLDLIMPDIDGFEVLDRLKSEPSTQDIPVIIYSAKDLAREELLRLSSSAQAILSKPRVTRDALLSQIRKVLESAG